jgi:hypothetical protein
LHTGRDVGNRATLAEIQQAKENDPAYQNMSEQDHKEAIDGLIAYRVGKKSNAHVTSQGAARDVFVTMERIEAEVRQFYYLSIFLLKQPSQFQSMHSRTGVEYYAMITRGSVDDMIQPSWLGSEGAAVFFSDTLATNAWDLLRQFEQSCCARKFGK